MAQRVELEHILKWLPPRRQESHKGCYGRALAVAGSARFRGAAALAAEGLLRGGAGLVTLAATEPVLAGVLPRLPECMCLPCAQNRQGGISRTAAPAIAQAAARSNALLFGPGLGDTPDTAALAQQVVSAALGAVLLDADGLNAAARMDRLPQPKNGPLVLTPHPGEMARLCGVSPAEVEAGRESIAVGYARAHDCVVVLKGHRTLVAGPQGEVYQNTTGNAGLARGGSGDALAGLLAALLAQGLAAVPAAVCAVWLHGAAADRCAARLGQYAMLPHDLFYDLGRILAEHGR